MSKASSSTYALSTSTQDVGRRHLVNVQQAQGTMYVRSLCCAGWQFTLPARWIGVVSTGVVRVDGAVVRVVFGTTERVLVEAALFRHAIRVVQAVRVAQEEFKVPLA